MRTMGVWTERKSARGVRVRDRMAGQVGTGVTDTSSIASGDVCLAEGESLKEYFSRRLLATGHAGEAAMGAIDVSLKQLCEG